MNKVLLEAWVLEDEMNDVVAKVKKVTSAAVKVWYPSEWISGYARHSFEDGETYVSDDFAQTYVGLGEVFGFETVNGEPVHIFPWADDGNLIAVFDGSSDLDRLTKVDLGVWEAERWEREEWEEWEASFPSLTDANEELPF